MQYIDTCILLNVWNVSSNSTYQSIEALNAPGTDTPWYWLLLDMHAPAMQAAAVIH